MNTLRRRIGRRPAEPQKPDGSHKPPKPKHIHMRKLLFALASVSLIVTLIWYGRRTSSTTQVTAPASSAIGVTSPEARVDATPSATTTPLPTPVVAAEAGVRGSDEMPVPDFAKITAFQEWTLQWQQANADGREAMRDEGIRLARERRPEFKALIANDPRRALADAVPRVVRQDLPEEIVALLEKPVSVTGDYNVYLGRPAPGMPLPKGGLTLRYFEAGGTSYKARVFGSMKPVMSKKEVPLRGVAVDREFAVAESAVRRLETGERITPGTVVEETCPVSGKTSTALVAGETVTDETPVVELGERVIRLCNGSHVTVLEDQARTRIQASGPGGAGFYLDNFPGTSSRAIGNLRCLYIRVTYPDQLAQPNTEERAYADMRDNARFYLESSYGKLTQTTTVTSLVTLPHTLAWYKAKDAEVDGLGLIHTDSRNAARALGYDPGQFDCIIVRIDKGPRLEGISWGGGTSVWVTWDGMDVLNHECGHSLGRSHANSWDSLDGTPYGYGQNGEYGNPFDVMGGSGGFSAQYNTVSKRDLGWLPNSNVHQATSGGVYRIYAYDQPTLEEGKRYALTVAKDSVRQYNLEFHPARGGFLAENALVIYSGMGANSGHLLDTTQGSLDGKNDGGIAVGRTYSDLEADMHFTVLSKNATTPPSLDIAYFRGPFTGNVAPTATLSASATTIAVGGSVNFTATASDTNGDSLAYHWQFDDGVTGTNSSAFTRSFPTAAQVTAMLTVSDMKGGAIRRSVVINVGSHGKQTVNGTITSGGQPLQGVYVSGDGKGCYSNVDGTYSLAGVSTGSQTLTATLAGYILTPSFSNPFNVVVGANTANWTAGGSTFVTLTKLADATEGGANGTFRLTRTGDTIADLTVLVSPVGGSAIMGTDYSFNPNYVASDPYYSFTIPAGLATRDVTVTAVNDVAAEGPETVTLQLAAATGYLASSASSVVMTIVDNDTSLPQVAVTASDPYAMEAPGSDPGAFTFTRTGATGAALNLSVAWSGSATNGTDYTTLATTVTIPIGQSSVNVNVVPIDDSAIEGPETVIATINNSATYVRNSTATSATVTLTDGDTPTVSVSVPDAAASETGPDSGMFLVTRTGSTAAALKVYYGLSGSALHGTDYAPLIGEVTIPIGAASAPVIIQPYDDDIAEPAETVTLAVANFNNTYSIGTPFQGTVTIADNNDTPLVNVRAGTVGIEGGSNATFVFHAIGHNAGNVTINYTVSGTASAGTDYTALSGSVNVPANGSSDATVTVPIINDVVAEPTETVVVKITPSANYRVYNDGVAEAVIQDNDSGGDRVMVSTYNQSPAEAGAAVGTFYFSRTGSTGALTVNYGISGTATNGADYTLLSGIVVIPDGQTGADVVITPIDDASAEGSETVTLTVLAGSGYGPDRPSSATFVIEDNEVPSVTVGFQQAGLVTAEQSGEYVDLPVILSAASANTITVAYTSAGGTAAGDDTDWAFVNTAAGNAIIPGGTLTFAPGVTTQNIRIRIKNDGVFEGSETAILQLLNPYRAALTKGRGQATVVIFDDATGPVVTEERWNTGAVYNNNTWNSITPDVTSYLNGFTSAVDIAEDFSRRLTGQIVAPTTGTYTFWIASDDASRLYLSTTSSPANKVQIATVTGWTSFQDWDANASQKSGNISLVAGQSYYMEVQHQEGGGGDHVSVAWQGPGFSRIPITFSAANSAPRTVRLATSATARQENDGTEPFLLAVLDRPAGSTSVTVDYTVSGTATAGSDFTLPPGSLTFSAGQQMKSIPLALLTDALQEAPESIIVSLANPVGATLAAPSTHTIALLDPSRPIVDTQFAVAASSQGVGTVIATLTATPSAGRTVAGWSIVAGNVGNAFAVNANGQVTLAIPGALPNPGGIQLTVRATDNAGAAGDGAINIVCNAPAQRVVEQRWNGEDAFWAENWSGAPSYAGTLANLTTATDVANNYSRRLLGYLRPQTTGDYTFWIAGDDDCRLYLSTDGYEANKVQIAAINGWTNFQAWDEMGSQESASIPLVAGKVYWIEAQQREGGGGDHVSVAWSGPGISRVAIPSTVMFQCVPGLAFAPPVPVFLVNTAPLVAGPVDRVINVNTNTGAVAFTINDDSPIAALSVGATSDNLTLVPNGNIVLGGSGTNRTVTVTPVANRLGTATITLTANDGSLQGSDTFVVNVVGTPQETWRFAHFGTTANTNSAADSSDPDGDSWTNSQEFTLGTDPNASNAAVLIITPAGSDVTLTFLARQATGPGYDGLTRYYDVQTNTSLTDPGSWIGLPGYTNIAGNGQTVTITQSVTSQPCYYRLVVRVQ